MTTASFSISEIAPVTLPKPRLRIGVILDSPLVPGWAKHIVDEIDGSRFGQLVLIVKLSRNPATKVSTGKTSHPRRPLLFELWQRLDQRFFSQRCARPEIFKPVSFSPRYDCPKHLECHPMEDELGLSLSSPDVATIRSFQLDVLINLTERPVQGEVLTAAEYGAWSLGDASESVASLFWVLYRGDSVRRTTVDIWKDRCNWRSQPASWSATDSLSFFRNSSSMYWNKSELLIRHLADLYRDGFESVAASLHPRIAPRPHLPTNLEVARLITRLISRAAKAQFTKHFLREEWFVGFRQTSGESNGPIAAIKRLRPPRGHFYADPFVIDKNGSTYIFFEDCSLSSHKAVISYVELDQIGRCSRPRIALEESFHLAYPQLFEWGGEIYLLPETKNNRTIQLYRATDFPRGWQLAHVLLRDVSAADSTLLYHHGKFWLFTSGLGTEDPWFDGDRELSLFFSDSLSGPWTAHPLNPVVSDVRGSRCAGQLFFRDGQLIRPAQDCSQVYGFAVTFNRVDRLSETEYHETPVGTLLPTWMNGNRGTHTFNRSGRYEVLDGRTLVARFWPRRTRPRIESTFTSRTELILARNYSHDDACTAD